MNVSIIATSGEGGGTVTPTVKEPDLVVVEVEEGEYEGRSKKFYRGYGDDTSADVNW